MPPKQPAANEHPNYRAAKGHLAVKVIEQPEVTKQPVITEQPKTPKRPKTTQQSNMSSQRKITKHPSFPKLTVDQQKTFKVKVNEARKDNESSMATEHANIQEQPKAAEHIDETGQSAAASRPSKGKGKLKGIYGERTWRHAHKPDTVPDDMTRRTLRKLVGDSVPEDPHNFVPPPPVGHVRSFQHATEFSATTTTAQNTPGASNEAEPDKTDTDRRPAPLDAFSVACPWNNFLDNFRNSLGPQEHQVLLAQNGHTLAPCSLRRIRPEDLALKSELERHKHASIDDFKQSAVAISGPISQV
ncbi:hypothetical protein BDW66DRAFT_151411 [Aspergillus desertorum]